MLETATAVTTSMMRIPLGRLMSNVTFLALARIHNDAVERLLLLDEVDSLDVRISLLMFF